MKEVASANAKGRLGRAKSAKPARLRRSDVADVDSLVAVRPSARTEKFDLRISRAAKLTLRRAADAMGVKVSQFVLESALVRALETLAEQRRFNLSAEQWEKFLEALDAPPRKLPALERLIQKPSVFER